MIEPVMEEIANAGFDTINTPFHFGAPMLSARLFKEHQRDFFTIIEIPLRNWLAFHHAPQLAVG